MIDASMLVRWEVDLLIAESKALSRAGPHFKIWHGRHEPGTMCWPGEVVMMAWLIHRGREYPLPFSRAVLIFFDFLARHKRLHLAASQIESMIRRDSFYAPQNRRTRPARLRPRWIARSSVRVYVERMRDVFTSTFESLGVQMDARKVLLSEETDGNEVRYWLNATVEWIHTS